jgi:hypothetical protein
LLTIHIQPRKEAGEDRGGSELEIRKKISMERLVVNVHITSPLYGN